MVPDPSTLSQPSSEASEQRPVLSLRGIQKSFGGPLALADVNFDVRSGRIHALLGMNGAGKSTLVQIISGSLPATSGEIVLNGAPFRTMTPRRARSAGVATVFQRRTLVGSLTVAENILMGELPVRAGFVDWREAHSLAGNALAAIRAEIDPRQTVNKLGAAHQTLVEIAREIRKGASLLMLDEPTAALGAVDARIVHDVVRGLAADGVAIIYISHHLDEVFELADDVTVLRDGHVVLDVPVASIDLKELVRAMVGEDVRSERRPRNNAVGEVRLELDDISAAGEIDGFSVAVRAGEIVAVLGPAGAAQESLFPILSGLSSPASGVIEVAGETLKQGSVRAALRAGVRCISVDRMGYGLIPGLSVAENITALEQAIARKAFVSWRAISLRARELREQFNVVSLHDNPAIESLSGGNQQKVLLGKLLANDHVVACLLEEPTGGVDISAKAEIHRYVEDLASRGVAVLLASSDVDEVLRLADRIVVVRGTAQVAECVATETTREELVAMVLGGQE